MTKSKYPDRIYVERDPETNEKRWYSVKGMGEEYVRAALPPDADVAGVVARLHAEEDRQQKVFDFVVTQRDKNGGSPAFSDINQIKHALSGRDPVLAPAADIITRLSAELATARAEIERMTPNFVAYDYLESPAGREIAEEELAKARAELDEMKRANKALEQNCRDFNEAGLLALHRAEKAEVDAANNENAAAVYSDDAEKWYARATAAEAERDSLRKALGRLFHLCEAGGDPFEEPNRAVVNECRAALGEKADG